MQTSAWLWAWQRSARAPTRMLRTLQRLAAGAGWPGCFLRCRPLRSTTATQRLNRLIDTFGSWRATDDIGAKHRWLPVFIIELRRNSDEPAANS